MQELKNNPSIRQSLIESIQNDSLQEVVASFLQWAENNKARLYYWAGGAWLAAFHRKAQVFLRLDDPPIPFLGRAYEVSLLEAIADMQTWEGELDGAWYRMLYEKYPTSCKPPSLWMPLYYLFASIRPEEVKGERQIVDGDGKRYTLAFYRDRLLVLEKEQWQPSL